MTNPKTAKLAFLSAILIYGTLGVFVRYAGQPSPLVALARSSIGTLFLLFLLAVKRQKIDFSAIRRNWRPLLIAGVLLGLNWVTLFEAYRYTTVAVATLCTYLNPIIIVFGAAILMHEQLTARKLLCIAVALIGMVFVSGVADSGLPDAGEAKGHPARPADGRALRLHRPQQQAAPRHLRLRPHARAAVHHDACPHPLLHPARRLRRPPDHGGQLALLLILGVVHTGFAYSLYFGSMAYLPAQTLAILSYLDPVTAVLLSALVLHEPLSGFEILGAVCILGAAVVSELPGRVKKM